MSWSGMGALALCIFFLGVGIVALVWPDRVQDWMLNFHQSGRAGAAWNPFLSWMKTSSYIVALRAVGILAIGAGFLVLMTLIRGGA